jgi:hypothetical protein
MSQSPLFYLLGDPSFGDHGVNAHPPLSLVSDQLLTPCCLTLPEDTPWFMLHVYIDDIRTSATLSDTVTAEPLCDSNLFVLAVSIVSLSLIKRCQQHY